MKRWMRVLALLGGLMVMASIAGAAAGPAEQAKSECRTYVDGVLPSVREWQKTASAPVPAGEIQTDSPALNARLASGQVTAHLYVPLCQQSQKVVALRLGELGYSSQDIAQMSPMRQELLAVTGIAPSDATAPAPSGITASQLYQAVVLTSDYDYCPNGAECRRIESVWWWRRHPFWTLEDRLALAWNHDWVFNEYTAYSRLSEYGCTRSADCRGFWFIDNSLWDAVLDNGFSFALDIHYAIVYQGRDYQVQEWQGTAGIDIYKDRDCQSNSCGYTTLTVMQRYYHQRLSLNFGVSFTKSPSMSASPSIVAVPSYSTTAAWRYRDE